MTAPRLLGIPCWVIPSFAGVAWLITLLTLITTWAVKGSLHYPEMWAEQQLPYISNIGASDWGQPIFITGSAVTSVVFIIAFALERWLRYRSQLVNYANVWSVTLSTLAGLLTVVGTIGLFLATVFDVRRHPYIHYSNAAMFILCYIFAAAFICAEKRHLIAWFPDNRMLWYSLRIKVYFIISEAVLVTVGTVTMYNGIHDPSVVMEWIIAMLFALYMSSFVIDFLLVPINDEKSDMARLLGPAWDEEHGISRPKPVYSFRSR